MTEDAVYDFAGERPTRDQLDGGRCIAVARYIKKTLPNSYDMDTAERAQYLSWGYGVAYIAEQGAADLITQPTSFFHDYAQVVAERLHGWGSPTTVDVLLASDTNVSAANLPKVMNNYSAFAGALGGYCVAGYAQTNVIDLLVAEGISRPGAKHWLPSAIGWSPGYRLPDGSYDWAKYLAYPYAGMVQRIEPSPVPGTDYNTVTDLASMGFEWPAGHHPSGGGTPIPEPLPLPKDDPMWKDAAIFIVGDGPAIGQMWLLLPDGRYFGIQNGTEVAAYKALGAVQPPGDASGYSLTGAGHTQFLAASPNYPYNNAADQTLPHLPPVEAKD